MEICVDFCGRLQAHNSCDPGLCSGHFSESEVKVTFMTFATDILLFLETALKREQIQTHTNWDDSVSVLVLKKTWYCQGIMSKRKKHKWTLVYSIKTIHSHQKSHWHPKHRRYSQSDPEEQKQLLWPPLSLSISVSLAREIPLWLTSV